MPKTNVTIKAYHPAFGDVEFTLQAKDSKDAFNTWKQVVFSARQWRVLSNSASSTGDKVRVSQDDIPSLSAVDEI